MNYNHHITYTQQFIKTLINKRGFIYGSKFRNIEMSSETLYCIYHSTEIPKCECGKNTIFKGFVKGFSIFCSSSCSNKSDITKQKKKEVCLKKYGKENPFQVEEFKEKTKKTNLEKLGVENPSQSKEIKQKKKSTKLTRYGNENYNNMNKHINTRLKNNNGKYKSDEELEKTKQTCLDKYGEDNVFKSEEIKEKIKKYNLRKYGVEFYNQTDEFKEKHKQTCLKNYGVEYPLQSKIIQQRRRDTSIKNGNIIEDKDRNNWDLYKTLVRRITNTQNISSLSNSELRSRADINPNGYHLDHKFSIYSGFKRNILPIYIGDINNLEFIPISENCKKHTNNSINENELLVTAVTQSITVSQT